MRLSQIILFCLLANFLVGQNKNPFDIIVSDQSESTSAQIDSKEQIEVKDDNPFNINNTIGTTISHEAKVRVSTTTIQTETNRYTPLTLTITILSLILVTLGINSNRSRFNKFLKSLINTNQLKGLMRSDKGMLNIQDFVLYLVFALNMSLLIYMLYKNYYSFETNFSWSYLMIIVIGVYLFRHIVQRLISAIFTFPKESILHGYSLMVHNVCIGVLLLPVLLGLQFGPASLHTFFFILGLGIVGLIYILRQGKGLLIALGIRGFNLMYFFIYLCAVEMAPVLILLKELSKNA